MNVETLHGVYAHMECQSTLSVETLPCNIHMDTNMDMDMDMVLLVTWSVECYMECTSI